MAPITITAPGVDSEREAALREAALRDSALREAIDWLRNDGNTSDYALERAEAHFALAPEDSECDGSCT